MNQLIDLKFIGWEKINVKLDFFVDGKSACLETESLTLKIGGNCMNISTHESKLEKRLFYKFSNLCNMECEYCFQSNDPVDHCINTEIILKRLEVFEEYFKNEKFERILFGGEPFLEKNLPYLNWLMNNTHHNFIAFTNGVFNETVKGFLINHINRFDGFAISIDGPEFIHNERRVFKGGNGFQRIIYNIKQLINHGLNLTIQTNIDSGNFKMIDLLLDFLEKQISFANNNVIFSLNRVLHHGKSSNELELLECGINMIKKYDDIALNINSITLKKLEKMFFEEGVSRKRCRIGEDIVADFSAGVMYTCPQNTSTTIGTLSNKILFDFDKINHYKLVNNKQNNMCLDCDLAYFCSRGCYFDEKSIDKTECKKSTRDALELILNNFSLFFDLVE